MNTLVFSSVGGGATGAGALKDKKNAHGGSSCPAQQILVIEVPPYPHPITLSTWGWGYQLHTQVVSRPAALGGGFIAKSESSVSVSCSIPQSLPHMLCACQCIIINPEQAVWQGLCLHLAMDLRLSGIKQSSTIGV